jgi:hypothetical protein
MGRFFVPSHPIPSEALIDYYTFMPIPLYLYTYTFQTMPIWPNPYIYILIYIYHYDSIRFWTIVIYYYRTQITLFGIIWCLIFGILFIISSLFVIALIPLYLANHSVEVTISNENCTLSLTSILHLSCFCQIILATDIWAIEYNTDYPYASTRAVLQANKQALAQLVSQTLKMSKIEKKM